ncbi:hypothetical protein [Croceicoccus bisphenolivorans]|uniref:hypothetical protein n=1 Tax=Croceicoccus bisphenolivorans TaxID=1783232 RepID=UPI000833E645|nr:hypothetical protein [Croceicoccus bisphenolivorans]
MDRGYRKGLRLKPDHKSRTTWLGLLIGSWIFIAILAWFDPFHIGRHRYEQPVREPAVTLITPKRGFADPEGVWYSGDGYGARFAVGNVAEAPVRYGTEDQLWRSSFATGGPQSLTEAWSLPAQAFIGEVGSAVRVVAVISEGYGQWSPDARIAVIDLPEPAETAMQGPEENRLVLSRGCLRLSNGDGPLVVLSPRANSVFIDDAGWLSVGSLSGMDSLRIGETGLIGTSALPASPAVEAGVNALRIQCGGNADVMVVDTLRRTPVCDLTPAQVAENRAAMNANQRAVTARMAGMRKEQIAPCLAQGRSEAECQASIPPMPPPPIDLARIPHKGRAPGEMCLPQSEVPAGKWTPDPVVNQSS